MTRPEALRAGACALRESKHEFAAQALELAAHAAEIVVDTSQSNEEYTESLHQALNALWTHVRRGTVT